MSLEDGAATVTAFIAEAVAYSLLLYLPEIPGKLIVCGGGAKNPTLVRFCGSACRISASRRQPKKV